MKMERKVYIRAFSRISICHPDPDYSGMFSIMEARRMSRLMKRALAVSKSTLDEAGISVPDAVVTGTGMGCIENTELFLRSLSGMSDAPLRPTHFMQSTHNTIGSLIAIKLGCHGYNATYSHSSVSFESALLDAFVQIRLGMLDNALVGAFEEMTPAFAAIMEKGGCKSLVMPDGSLSETAVSMLLSSSPDDAICELEGVQLASADAWDMDCTDFVSRYGGNFCIPALVACDAAEAIASGQRDRVVVQNALLDKPNANLILNRICGR